MRRPYFIVTLVGKDFSVTTHKNVVSIAKEWSDLVKDDLIILHKADGTQISARSGEYLLQVTEQKEGM